MDEPIVWYNGRRLYSLEYFSENGGMFGQFSDYMSILEWEIMGFVVKEGETPSCYVENSGEIVGMYHGEQVSRKPT